MIAPPSDVPKEVTIDRHLYEAVEAIASQMRPSEASAPRKYLGMVKELKGTPGPTGRAEGEVVFMLILEDGTSLRAKAQLEPTQYLTAVTAHAAPMPVMVEGELHRVRRGYELRRITEIYPFANKHSDEG